MPPEHDCGPEGDAAFFDELSAIFERYPEAARKYNVRCVDHEKDMMKIDFTKMEGRARIEGDRVITEFLAKEKTLDPASFCCQWEHTGQMGGGTWTCTQRW
jgi:hypothetical protein